MGRYKKMIISACQEDFGRKKKKKSWITQKTLDTIGEKQKTHEHLLSRKTRKRKLSLRQITEQNIKKKCER